MKLDPILKFEKAEDFLDKPKIIRVNGFGEKSLEEFEEDMDDAHSTGQPIIPIVIDSFGGSCYGLMGMIASIETSAVPVATILTSKAFSAGAVLFCFGAEGHRYMHPHATMMIHDARMLSEGKVEDVLSDVKHIDMINRKLYKRASKHIGHDENYLANLIKEKSHVDWFLSAKDAKKHNIANQLRIPRFEVDVTVKMRLV